MVIVMEISNNYYIQVLLVLGAAGGVGFSAVQIGKVCGAVVIAAARCFFFLLAIALCFFFFFVHFRTQKYWYQQIPGELKRCSF